MKNNQDLKEEIQKEFQKILNESRMTTFNFQILSDIKKNVPGIEKMLGMYSLADGMVGLFRYEDGNAYEIVVKSIASGDYKDLWGKIIQKKSVKEKPEEKYPKIDIKKLTGTKSPLNENIFSIFKEPSFEKRVFDDLSINLEHKYHISEKSFRILDKLAEIINELKNKPEILEFIKEQQGLQKEIRLISALIEDKYKDFLDKKIKQIIEQ